MCLQSLAQPHTRAAGLGVGWAACLTLGKKCAGGGGGGGRGMLGQLGLQDPRRPAGGEDALVVLVRLGELEPCRGSWDGSQRDPASQAVLVKM